MFSTKRCFMTSNYWRILRNYILLRITKNKSVLKYFFSRTCISHHLWEEISMYFTKRGQGWKDHIPIRIRKVKQELGYIKVVRTTCLPTKILSHTKRTRKHPCQWFTISENYVCGEFSKSRGLFSSMCYLETKMNYKLIHTKQTYS